MTGGILEPGVALIAPGDDHMVLEKHGFGVQIRANQQPPENSCRPAVDVLFRSTAKIYDAGVLAVVLTGMGQDGLHGCEGIREAGGQIIVQDEVSSVFGVCWEVWLILVLPIEWYPWKQWQAKLSIEFDC
jgi:Chemotaxis response regulator containing a CheY-like receiver domain and a methylesterase domain